MTDQLIAKSVSVVCNSCSNEWWINLSGVDTGKHVTWDKGGGNVRLEGRRVVCNKCGSDDITVGEISELEQVAS